MPRLPDAGLAGPLIGSRLTGAFPKSIPQWRGEQGLHKARPVPHSGSRPGHRPLMIELRRGGCGKGWRCFGCLEAGCRSAHPISLADCLWQAVDRYEGTEALAALGRQGLCR